MQPDFMMRHLETVIYGNYSAIKSSLNSSEHVSQKCNQKLLYAEVMNMIPKMWLLSVNVYCILEALRLTKETSVACL